MLVPSYPKHEITTSIKKETGPGAWLYCLLLSCFGYASWWYQYLLFYSFSNTFNFTTVASVAAAWSRSSPTAPRSTTTTAPTASSSLVSTGGRRPAPDDRKGSETGSIFMLRKLIWNKEKTGIEIHVKDQTSFLERYSPNESEFVYAYVGYTHYSFSLEWLWFQVGLIHYRCNDARCWGNKSHLFLKCFSLQIG